MMAQGLANPLQCGNANRPAFPRIPRSMPKA